jgi:hypothetical protein
MANLITASELATYKSAINDMHDTFGRMITVWLKSAETITIPTNDQQDDYDAFYDNKVGSTSTIVYTSKSVEIKARIKYLDKNDKEFGLAIASAENRINVTQEFKIIRIKVDEQGSNYVDKAEKLTIDGLDYGLISTSRPSGIVTLDYFTYYLQSLI